MSGVEKKTCALPADLTKAHLFKRALHGEELRDEGMLKTHELSYARRMPQTTYHYRHPHGMTQADGDSPSEEPDLFNESRRAESSVNEKKQIGVISINQLPKEVNLEIMGFKNTEPINWNTVELPPKTDLHALLHYRITNYISPDVLVKISNHEYRCHLLVLQCYSGFFVDQQPPMQRIEIAEECVTKSAFAHIYDWMIHRGTDSYTMLKRDNILDIFMGAQYLQVKELEEQCWAFIDNEDLFSEDQAFLLYLEARKLGNTAVMELMVPRIQRFFLTLVASKDFLDLVEEEVSVFLRSNYICVHSEMEVFMSAVRWLTFDWDRRQKSLANLMACVRFGLIAPWQLVDIRRNPENQEFLLVTRDPIVAKMIEDGLAFAIIKNMYGHDSSEYSREIETLGLSEPQARNWAGTVKKYMTYNEFLLDLQNYRNVQKMAKNQGVGDRVNSCESVQSDLEHLRKVVHRAI